MSNKIISQLTRKFEAELSKANGYNRGRAPEWGAAASAASKLLRAMQQLCA